MQIRASKHGRLRKNIYKIYKILYLYRYIIYTNIQVRANIVSMKQGEKTHSLGKRGEATNGYRGKVSTKKLSSCAGQIEKREKEEATIPYSSYRCKQRDGSRKQQDISYSSNRHKQN